MPTIYKKTDYGDFHVVRNYHFEQKKPTIIFFTSMGINSSYYDYYNLVNSIKSNINYLLIDLLGAGESSLPNNPTRTIENISQEVSECINSFALDEIYICCHSFTAMYLLNAISSRLIKSQILGFIGIDPSSADTMLNSKDVFSQNLDEALNNKKKKEELQEIKYPDADVNPLLSQEMYDKCFSLYCSLSGSNSEISELNMAIANSKKMRGVKLPKDIPSLSFISTLNARDYEKFGNPYFNLNNKSFEIKMNGHHFLHWIHPVLMGKLIYQFTNNTTSPK